MEEPIVVQKKRGFAAMSPERQKEMAAIGGRAAQRMGRAHRFNSEEAKIAGQRGGKIVSQNRAHMAEIGRRGGSSSRTPEEEPLIENFWLLI